MAKDRVGKVIKAVNVFYQVEEAQTKVYKLDEELNERLGKLTNDEFALYARLTTPVR